MLRDPNRIRPLLERLAVFWEKHPDLRLGQIINGVADGIKTPVFYTEDEELISALEYWDRLPPA